MKYKNSTQIARRKFLEGKSLSSKEQAVIDRDLEGEDFIYFKQSKNSPLLLPNKYSAETTFHNISALTGRKQVDTRKRVIRYAASIAAILLVAIISVGIFNTLGQPNMVVVSTAMGEQKQIMLPDGSLVMLNGLSSLTYPENMDTKTREVKLDGEAYFEVSKSLGRTFVVKTNYLDVKVLGTKFNIEAYENKGNVITSLLEGSVCIDIHNGGSQQLKPGDKGVYTKDKSSFQIENSDNIDNEVYWVTGTLNFDNLSLNEIFAILEQEKNISINLSDNNFGKLKISARFTHNESVEEILDILGESAGFTYNKQNNTYSIRRKL